MAIFREKGIRATSVTRKQQPMKNDRTEAEVLAVAAYA